MAGAALPEIHPPDYKVLAKKVFGQQTLMFVGAGTVLNYALDNPHEWDQDTLGLGQRFASGFGRHMIKSSVQFGVSTLRNEDLTYYRSGKSGFAPRVRHAVTSVVVGRNKTTGEPTFAGGRITGVLTGAFVSRKWHPERLQTVPNALATSAVSLGMEAAFNVIREFWKEIRQRGGKRD